MPLRVFASAGGNFTRWTAGVERRGAAVVNVRIGHQLPSGISLTVFTTEASSEGTLSWHDLQRGARIASLYVRLSNCQEPGSVDDALSQAAVDAKAADRWESSYIFVDGVSTLFRYVICEGHYLAVGVSGEELIVLNARHVSATPGIVLVSVDDW
jgi:hypothetical protein